MRGVVKTLFKYLIISVKVSSFFVYLIIRDVILFYFLDISSTDLEVDLSVSIKQINDRDEFSCFYRFSWQAFVK